MKNPEDQRCAICRFAGEPGELKLRECRVKPPRFIADGGQRGFFPLVGDADWCGEFARDPALPIPSWVGQCAPVDLDNEEMETLTGLGVIRAAWGGEDQGATWPLDSWVASGGPVHDRLVVGWFLRFRDRAPGRVLLAVLARALWGGRIFHLTRTRIVDQHVRDPAHRRQGPAALAWGEGWDLDDDER